MTQRHGIDYLSGKSVISEQEFFAIMIEIMGEKDNYSACVDLPQKTAYYAGKIGNEVRKTLKLPGTELLMLRQAASVSEIGKLVVPDSILYKPGPLTNEEREVIQMHPATGARILSHLRRNPYTKISNIVLHHHERWDGKGYTNGLEGEQIPLQSRIIGVAEQFVSLTSYRIYRKSCSPYDAVDKIKLMDGAYDPRVVSALETVVLKEELKK